VPAFDRGIVLPIVGRRVVSREFCFTLSACFEGTYALPYTSCCSLLEPQFLRRLPSRGPAERRRSSSPTMDALGCGGEEAMACRQFDHCQRGLRQWSTRGPHYPRGGLEYLLTYIGSVQAQAVERALLFSGASEANI
jgi:hypothetical protein